MPAVGQIKPNEYQCAMCQGVFEYGWSDDQSTTELSNNFPGFEKDDCAVICDDCYQGTGLFCGPPEDPFKEIPKPMREIFRRRFDEVKEKVQTEFENHIFYGTSLNPNGLQ